MTKEVLNVGRANWDNRLSISQWALNNYKTCPYKYYCYCKLKHKDAEESENLKLGNYIHAVLMKYGQKVMGNQACYASEIEKEIPPSDLSDEFKTRFTDIVKEVANHWIQVFSRDIISVEGWIEPVKIKDKVYLTAKYDRLDWDLVEDRAYIYDYKTGKVEGDFLEYDFQYLIYSKYMEFRFPNTKERIIRFISFKDGMKVYELEASTKNYQKVVDMATKIETDTKFDPTPCRLCDWCGLQKEGFCPAYKGQDLRTNMPSVNAPVPTTTQAMTERKEVFDVDMGNGITVKCGIKVNCESDKIAKVMAELGDQTYTHVLKVKHGDDKKALQEAMPF